MDHRSTVPLDKNQRLTVSCSCVVHFCYNLYIFPSFPSVFPSVGFHPSTAYGPTDFIFAMQVDLGRDSVIFGKPRSKVKLYCYI